MKKLFLILITLISLNSGLLYSHFNFPLQTGNKFVYHYTYYSYWWGHAGSGGNYKISYRIIKDSTFSGHKYFLMNAYPNYSNTNVWVRFDTTTKSIYAFDPANTCPFYFKETLIDSLSMMSGTANSCSNKYLYGVKIDTLYNVIDTTKTFRVNITNGHKSLNYNSNFGIVGYEYYKFDGQYGDDNFGVMLGCFIDGIKYGDTSLTSIRVVNNFVPQNYLLSQNYPNPFNPSTTIKFDLPKSSAVRLSVYDITGKEIETLVDEKLNAGSYETKWDGSKYESGVYFCRLTAGDYTSTTKMLMIK